MRQFCFSTIAATTLALSACGGGGGGASNEPFGLVKITAVDSFGTAIADATITGPQGSSKTDAAGGALVVLGTSGSTATLTLTRDTFADQSIVVSSTTGTIKDVAVTLKRVTSPAGGSLSSRSGVVPTVSSDGKQLRFEIELVVVDGNSQPISNLSAANFVLRACAPDPADARADCVSGPSALSDKAYAPLQPSAEALTLVPASPAQPYAVGLLLDQSGSIAQSDSTRARIYSSKAFLAGLGDGDQVLLAAFAGGSDARIPTAPLTLYAPFRDRTTSSNYYPILDVLAPQVGGDTPLYDSLNSLRRQVVGTASLPTGLGKALIVFTDGADTRCGTPEACNTTRAQSIQAAKQDGVKLFTIGLSNAVDNAALGQLATQTGGAFLYAASPQQLIPLYGSVGKLLSSSLPTYRLRWTLQASEAGMFVPGNAVLGRVQVSVSGVPFDVPFIVGIP